MAIGEFMQGAARVIQSPLLQAQQAAFETEQKAGLLDIEAAKEKSKQVQANKKAQAEAHALINDLEGLEANLDLTPTSRSIYNNIINTLEDTYDKTIAAGGTADQAVAKMGSLVRNFNNTTRKDFEALNDYAGKIIAAGQKGEVHKEQYASFMNELLNLNKVAQETGQLPKDSLSRIAQLGAKLEPEKDLQTDFLKFVKMQGTQEKFLDTPVTVRGNTYVGETVEFVPADKEDTLLQQLKNYETNFPLNFQEDYGGMSPEEYIESQKVELPGVGEVILTATKQKTLGTVPRPTGDGASRVTLGEPRRVDLTTNITLGGNDYGQMLVQNYSKPQKGTIVVPSLDAMSKRAVPPIIDLQKNAPFQAPQQKENQTVSYEATGEAKVGENEFIVAKIRYQPQIITEEMLSALGELQRKEIEKITDPVERMMYIEQAKRSGLFDNVALVLINKPYATGVPVSGDSGVPRVVERGTASDDETGSMYDDYSQSTK